MRHASPRGAALRPAGDGPGRHGTRTSACRSPGGPVAWPIWRSAQVGSRATSSSSCSGPIGWTRWAEGTCASSSTVRDGWSAGSRPSTIGSAGWSSTDVQAWREALDEADVPHALAVATGPLLEGLDLNATVEFGDWLETERTPDAAATQRRRGGALPGAGARRAGGRDRHGRGALGVGSARRACGPMQPAGAGPRGTRRCARADVPGVRRPPRARGRRRAVGRDAGVVPAVTHLRPRLGHRKRRPSLRGHRTSASQWGTASFVGRRVELAQLDECLAAALAGHGGVVAVEGEAGVGKTRLVEQFLSRAPPGIARFAARCYERDLSAPLEPIRTALDVWDETAPARRAEDLRFGTTEPRDRGNVLRA
jgi:hypothetical protein